MSYIAPAGTPVTLRDVWAGIAGAGARAHDHLTTLLCEISGRERCFTFSSGRAAMVAALRAMASIAGPTRTRVVVPGYTCYSVPAAVRRAGLTPVFCDVNPQTLSLDLECLRQVDFRSVLAVVSANLYGVPNDLAAIEALAEERGVFLLDDAAQALGARQRGRPAGGFGTIGLFSFDKGKNIATIQGGALVVNSGRVAEAVAAEWEALSPPGMVDSASNGAKLFVYSLLLEPALYGLVQSLPFLGLGKTIYDESFAVTRYSSALAAVAARLCTRLTAINATRIENAARLREALQGLPHIRSLDPTPGAEPVYLRYPLQVATPDLRQRFVAELNRHGIGATTSYPLALGDVAEIKAYARAGDLPGSRSVARSIVTLPTHAYCPADMAARAREIIESCSAQR